MLNRKPGRYVWTWEAAVEQMYYAWPNRLEKQVLFMVLKYRMGCLKKPAGMQKNLEWPMFSLSEANLKSLIFLII